MRDVVIVDGYRTPFVKAGTKLENMNAVELGQSVVRELLLRTEIPLKEVEEVIFGNVGNPADAINISRVVALRSGLSKEVPAMTVQRNCASALESISTGYEKIKSGSADVVVAGGTESMSQMPFLFSRKLQMLLAQIMMGKSLGQKLAALSKFKMAYLKPRIALVEGLTDPFVGINMGQTAEILAKEFGISREEQDRFALESHRKASQAMKSGRFEKEIVPVYPLPKFDVVAEDVGPRENQKLEKLAKLRPYFDRRFGTVTVGNACPITDGAAAVLLMSREKAQALGYKPVVSIKSYAYAGLEPERMGLGPVYATPKALKKAQLQLKDMGLVELNEAFAAQVLACKSAFESSQFAKDRLGLSEAVGELSMDRLNVNGGAIALGHPVGTTGTRLVVTLMKEMALKNVQFGLATLCIGGGQGGAMILEKEVA